METCEPVRIACPKCGSRYKIKGEEIFNLRQTSCGKCREVLPLAPHLLRRQPVREDDILGWLRSGESDD